jgi:hypothetical protein
VLLMLTGRIVFGEPVMGSSGSGSSTDLAATLSLPCSEGLGAPLEELPFFFWNILLCKEGM